MKSTLTAVLVAATLVTSAAAEVQRRTLNNGNLVLEDIPEIPGSVVEALNRYQNVRSAPLLDWTSQSSAVTF